MTVEQVKALREAFVAGTVFATLDKNAGLTPAQLEAARRYPMPLVEVPRVIDVEGVQVRVVNGVIEVQSGPAAWNPTHVYAAATVRALAALLANPTERVEVSE